MLPKYIFVSSVFTSEVCKRSEIHGFRFFLRLDLLSLIKTMPPKMTASFAGSIPLPLIFSFSAISSRIIVDLPCEHLQIDIQPELIVTRITVSAFSITLTNLVEFVLKVIKLRSMNSFYPNSQYLNDMPIIMCYLPFRLCPIDVQLRSEWSTPWARPGMWSTLCVRAVKSPFWVRDIMKRRA